MIMDKLTRRVRAGQPPADLEDWEVDLNDLPEEPLPHWKSMLIVVGIMLAVASFAVFVVRVL
jgi:hypothetical protein